MVRQHYPSLVGRYSPALAAHHHNLSHLPLGRALPASQTSYASP
jgi:hypothetical protein